MAENPANLLRLVGYPFIYKVLYIPGGWEWDFFQNNCMSKGKLWYRPRKIINPIIHLI